MQWGQKRIEWGYSNKSSVSGIGPVEDVNSADITCRFNPVQPPALKGVARAGAEVKYVWTDYYNSHQGPVVTVGLRK
jgi:lytic cellulose monooxygenase (C1-hydroxylating)